MTRTLLERAHRLIKAATGEVYGDGYIVTDLCVGYAEPGYGSDESVVVFGDWNDKDNRRWVKPENGGAMVREGNPPTRKERIPSRLFDALERIGVNCEWYDEWMQCGDCYRAFRTQPDSYSWTMYGAWTEYGYTCADCLAKAVGAYVDEYVNDSDKAITWTGNDTGLTGIGFTLWNVDSYQNGWHSGRDDKPSEIMDRIHNELGSDTEVVFLIDGVGQFDCHFSAYYRTEEPDSV